MQIERMATIYYSVACFFSASIGVMFLWWYAGDHSYVVLGIRDKEYLLLIPVITTVFAAFWGKFLTIKLLKSEVTPITTYRWFGSGLLVAISTFVSYTFIHAIIASCCVPIGMYLGSIIPVWLSFTMFGFILFGWALIIVGGLTGVLLSRLNSNNSLSQTGAHDAPPG